MENPPCILFCPLHWGLGHATRDLPLMHFLSRAGYRIVVATEEPLQSLIKQAVPQAEFDSFPGPRIRYAPGPLLPLKLLFQIPRWLFWLQKEKKNHSKAGSQTPSPGHCIRQPLRGPSSGD